MDKDTERYILNILRLGTTKWAGRNDCLKRFRTKVYVRDTKAGEPVFKFFYQCQACFELYRDASQVEVDHIDEVGPFTGDWSDYVQRLYCDQDNLTVLCTVCHLKKTKKFASARAKWKRKKAVR